MNKNTKSMFEAIKQSLTSNQPSQEGNGLYKEILKFKPDNTYVVRLVPNAKSPKDTIFHYYNHAWTSNSTGNFVTALCPTTFGQTCPIDAYYLKTYRTGTDSEKEASRVLSRKEGWMVNVYVVSDPVNPENNGQVKILRYGKELAKIIQNAIDGDDAEDIGVEKVFDLKNGCSLRIKCENRAGNKGSKSQYITYASSKFISPSEIDVDEAEIQEKIHDLLAVNRQTSTADMQRLLDEHYFNLSTGSADDSDNEEETIHSHETSSTNEETDESTDEKLKKLMAQL